MTLRKSGNRNSAEAPVAVITGGSRGIGFQTGRFLASQGWRTALCSRRLSDARKAAKAITADFNTPSVGVSADVANFQSLEEFANSVSKEWGVVRLLLCNAAVIGPIGKIADVDSRSVQAAVATNFLGVTNSIQAFWSLLSETSDFRIVALTGGGLGGPNQVHRAPGYVPTKAAVASLVEILSEEVREAGGTINAVAPGNIPTDFMKSVLEADVDDAGDVLLAQAQDRDGKGIGDSLDDFFSLLSFILSNESLHINGRFLSSRWNSKNQLQELTASDWSDSFLRLRRIDDQLFGKIAHDK